MISFNRNDVQMAAHASEVMQDRCLDEGGFTEEDYQSAVKIGTIRRGLLVTGAEQTQSDADALLKEVVSAELDSWIPDASQRLINRAVMLLGSDGPLLDPILVRDHGPNPGDHSLIQDWVCGIFVLRCCTCAHLFKV